tara:strand:- start:355 stop:870 length:516 start_codon:yes stop_codon:yes gene_type:complete
MAQIPQTNVSISAINAEVSSVSSTNLRVLSDAAVAGSDPKDGQPYGMGEFRGYLHNFSTTFSGYSTNSGGKADITRYFTTLANSTVVHSDGTFTVGLSSLRGGSSGIRIMWNNQSSVSTGWTSVTIAQSGASTFTINRSAMTAGYDATTYAHTSSSYNLTGSGTGSLTFNV